MKQNNVPSFKIRHNWWNSFIIFPLLVSSFIVTVLGLKTLHFSKNDNAFIIFFTVTMTSLFTVGFFVINILRKKNYPVIKLYSNNILLGQERIDINNIVSIDFDSRRDNENRIKTSARTDKENIIIYLSDGKKYYIRSDAYRNIHYLKQYLQQTVIEKKIFSPLKPTKLHHSKKSTKQKMVFKPKFPDIFKLLILVIALPLLIAITADESSMIYNDTWTFIILMTVGISFFFTIDSFIVEIDDNNVTIKNSIICFIKYRYPLNSIREIIFHETHYARRSLNGITVMLTDFRQRRHVTYISSRDTYTNMVECLKNHNIDAFDYINLPEKSDILKPIMVKRKRSFHKR